MEAIKESIKDLLEQVKQDEYACYKSEWEWNAVDALNQYYVETDQYDDYIYPTDGDEWEEIVKGQVDQRGYQGVLYFLGKMEPTDDYAELDGYGNAKPVSGKDMLTYLKWALEEIEKGEA